METLRCTPTPTYRSPSRPAGAPERDVAAAIRTAVHDLRNRLLVFYSATAWSRAQHAEGAADLRAAADLLERFAEELRAPLLTLVGALERARSENVTDDIDLVTETGEAAMRFAAAVEQPMTTLRRALVLYDIDGMELLADLEDALARVREIASSLLACDPA